MTNKILEAIKTGKLYTAPWGADDHANLRVKCDDGLDADVARCCNGEVAKLIVSAFRKEAQNDKA